MAHAHLQLQTFPSDIIWIMANEIILLLFRFNLNIIRISYTLFYKSEFEHGRSMPPCIKMAATYIS
jgi:hypothetical protein